MGCGKEEMIIYRQLERYGRRKNMTDEGALDFASWAFIKIQEHGRKPFHWHYADYCRETLGRKGQKIEIENAVRRGDNGTLERIQNVVPENSAGVSDRKGADRKLCTVFKRFTGKNRAIVFLYFKHGFKEAEIGEMFGVGESRICQMLKPLKAIYGASLATDKFDNVDILNVDWIQI